MDKYKVGELYTTEGGQLAAVFTGGDPNNRLVRIFGHSIKGNRGYIIESSYEKEWYQEMHERAYEMLMTARGYNYTINEFDDKSLTPLEPISLKVPISFLTIAI